ncbi:MAG: lysine--tRNA ligase [bacterium]|nr:lysine--tRNA ligase [bacterium]
MRWLVRLVDQIVEKYPNGPILIESGASPSGTYHIGHLREIVTCDAILLEVRSRGREARHVHFVDNLDALRKIPINIPADFDQYLGKPLCDIPSPDGAAKSYGDHFLAGLLSSAEALSIEIEVVYSHDKYRSGYFIPAIEKVLSKIPETRQTLESVSGRRLDEHWSPIQVNEDGYLKNRTFINIDIDSKEITYADRENNQRKTRYDNGSVKLDWRLDWPARWWLMEVNVEPFGRDHASAGGSFDTGKQLMKEVFNNTAPTPVPYDFINRAGDTKKMSASKGTGIAAEEAVRVLPAEVLRYFILSAPPEKRLYFDAVDGTIRLVDEFAALSAKDNLSEDEQHTLTICNRGSRQKTVSRIPFSHLVASYQAALKNSDITLEVMRRTEHLEIVNQDKEIIERELKFIEAWLEAWAPEEVKFTLRESIDASEFTELQKSFLLALAQKINEAPENADGEWFHKAVYDLKEQSGLEPKELFQSLYRALINKDAGPRAGWFLSLLPRDWLIKRLLFEE